MRTSPAEATASMEVDVAFFDDPDDTKADLVDGAIGELSSFHETFGYYAQGVSVGTAVLPTGWRNRVLVFATPSTEPGRGLCLEPHDCVLSKLVAGREKDVAFANALVQEGLIDLDVLADRINTLDTHPLVVRRIRDWLAGQQRYFLAKERGLARLEEGQDLGAGGHIRTGRNQLHER